LIAPFIYHSAPFRNLFIYDFGGLLNYLPNYLPNLMILPDIEAINAGPDYMFSKVINKLAF